MQTLSRQPGHVPTRLDIARMMLGIGRWDAAVPQLRHALEAADPEDRRVKEAFVRAVEEAGNRGQTDAARELCLAYLVENPEDDQIKNLWSGLVDSDDARAIVDIHRCKPGRYRVSAIISTYASEAFIRECLDNMLAQTIGPELEIVVVDAASPENERAVVREYQSRYDNITYIRTRARIGVYAAWNIAVAHATGMYCVSMSTNDQMAPDGCEQLARALDRNPEAVLAYGNTVLTRQPHETFARNSHDGVYRWPEYDFNDHLQKGCCIGPHPMWRRSVHEQVGYFDERFIADGDQEFWLRLGARYPLKHIDGFTGLQWITPDSLSGRGNIPMLEVAVIHAMVRQAMVRRGRRQLNDGPETMEAPLVTAIVSTYNAEKFIRGCLESLEAQTIAHRLEIIVIDSASPQQEGEIVREFQRRFPNIRYLRTPRRENVYAAWNRGIKLAKGLYVTNANTDDRHRRDALEQMAGVMEAQPEIDVVYADVIKTRIPNQTFDNCTPSGVLCWPDWDRRRMLFEGCFIGPQPMWRRSVHDTHGYFNEHYSISADYEFWLRISRTCRFHHIPAPLGLYLDHDESIEHRDPEVKRQQDLAIVQTYRSAVQQEKAMDMSDYSMVDPSFPETTQSPVPTSSCNWAQSNQGGTTMLTPETILAGIGQLAEGERKDVASWALDKLLADYPDHPAAHNNRAVLAFEQGDHLTAGRHYERAAELAPDNAGFQKDLGDFYVCQNQPEKALARFERVLAAYPDHIGTLLAAGHLNVSLQRFENARHYYQRVLALEPGHADARRFLDKLDTPKTEPIRMATLDELYAAAMQKADAGLNDEAVALMEQLVSRDPENATVHNDLGVLYYRRGDMDNALDHYDKAASLVPENGVFQKNLADFLWIEKGDIQTAMQLYVRALTLDPRDVEALLCCGRICMQLRKNDDARVFFNSALENEPWNEDARKLLDELDRPAAGGHAPAAQPPSMVPDNQTLYQNAQQKAENGDLQGAIAELENLVSRDPMNAAGHNDLGVLYYQQGRQDKALASYEQAVRLSPDDPTYQKNLADYYLMAAGRVEDALGLYIKVLEKNPEDVDCLLANGVICEKMNNPGEARFFYQRALEVEPWNANARQAMERLDRREADKAGQGGVSRVAG